MIIVLWVCFRDSRRLLGWEIRSLIIFKRVIFCMTSGKKCRNVLENKSLWDSGISVCLVSRGTNSFCFRLYFQGVLCFFLVRQPWKIYIVSPTPPSTLQPPSRRWRAGAHLFTIQYSKDNVFGGKGQAGFLAVYYKKIGDFLSLEFLTCEANSLQVHHSPEPHHVAPGKTWGQGNWLNMSLVLLAGCAMSNTALWPQSPHLLPASMKL